MSPEGPAGQEPVLLIGIPTNPEVTLRTYLAIVASTHSMVDVPGQILVGVDRIGVRG